MKSFFKLTIIALVGLFLSSVVGNGVAYAQDEAGDADRITVLLVPYPSTDIAEMLITYEGGDMNFWPFIVNDSHFEWPMRRHMYKVGQFDLHNKSRGYNPGTDWLSLRNC